MKKKNLKKSCTALMLSAAMMAGSVLPALAADASPKYTYSGGGVTFEKISHADTGTEQADGIVDYMGNGSIAPYVSGESELGNGDRGQSYSYASASYGDWIYVNTMYGGLGANAILNRGLGDLSPEAAAATVNAMYNGVMYTGEPDGKSAGGILVKFNVKTGETKILMSKETNGIMPTFRSAIKMNGKLYFVGMVIDVNNKELTQQEIAYATAMQNGFPCIYEVDPANNDKLTCIYNCVDTKGFRQLVNSNVFTSTRAIGTFGDAMIAGCLDTNGVFLTASKDPSAGQDSFKVIADMNDLFNYPAYHRSDVNGGGGIYQVIEYNGALYVVICTGTAESKNDQGTLQTFAIVKGVCNGDVTDKSAWSWSVLAGDEKDGARYPFGLDKERVSAGACTLQVYGDYLYIGDYNDVSSALQGFVLRKDFTTQATNLEQSINLYRMDKSENIEKVVGDPTEAFPTSLTGLGSGYTAADGEEQLGTHMNQYTWQTTVYNGKLYVGTMDTTTLLEPIAQFTNGDLLKMSKEEWERQINYIRVLLELMFKTDEETSLTEDAAGETEVAEDANTAEDAEVQNDTENRAVVTDVMDEESAKQLVEAAIQSAQQRADEAAVATFAANGQSEDTITLTKEQTKELVSGLLDGSIAEGMISEDLMNQLTQINSTLAAMKDLIDTTEVEEFADAYEQMDEAFGVIKELLPDNVKALYEMILEYATKENIKGLAKSLKYLKTSERGFDLFEITDNGGTDVTVQKVTTDGFGDRYNHGLRIFEKTKDYWVIGTANPFYGTQLWRTTNLDPTPVDPEPEPTPNPEPTPSPEDPKTPATPTTADTTKKTTATDKKSSTTKTGDRSPIVLMFALLAGSAVAAAGTAGYKMRKKRK